MANDVERPRQPLSDAGSPPTLEVRRTIRAPRQRVFDAWTKAEELTRWHSPGSATVGLAEVDLRVGGQWRIDMRGPGGEMWSVRGEYREIDPPLRLVYSWMWAHDPIDSTVTIELHDRGDATEVVLRHDGLTQPKSVEGHEQGWVGCFDKLSALFP